MINLLEVISELLKEKDSVSDRSFPDNLVGSRADVNSLVLLFLSSQHEDEVVLSELCFADLLVESVTAEITINKKACVVDDLLDLGGIVVDVRANGDDHDLTRRDPKRPLSASVFDENRDEALEGSVDGTMNHHGSDELVVMRLEFEIETVG